MQTNGNDRINRQKSGRKGLSAYHMALGGILLALCIAGVFMSSIVPGAEMTLLLVASAGIFIFCREAGAAGGAVLYAAACGLSLILVPNKLAVLAIAAVCLVGAFIYMCTIPLPTGFAQMNFFEFNK